MAAISLFPFADFWLLNREELIDGYVFQHLLHPTRPADTYAQRGQKSDCCNASSSPGALFLLAREKAYLLLSRK